MENNLERPKVIITKSPKSMGIALLLTALFGPIGMFYATIIGAIVMSVIYIVIAVATMGLGFIILFLLNPVCMIWAAISVKMSNKALMKEVM